MDCTQVRAAWSSAAIAAVCSVLVYTDSHAAGVTFVWDPVSGTAGYAFHSGEATGSYSNRNEVGNTTTIQVNGLLEGTTYYFAVTAYDAAKLESNYSNEVSVTVPYGPPVVDFSANPATGTTPATVAFSNGTTGEVTSWAWSFGDGGTSSGQSPTYVYSTAGDYWVTLKAMGPGGTVSKTLETPIKITAGSTTTTPTRKGRGPKPKVR